MTTEFSLPSEPVAASPLDELNQLAAEHGRSWSPQIKAFIKDRNRWLHTPDLMADFPVEGEGKSIPAFERRSFNKYRRVFDVALNGVSTDDTLTYNWQSKFTGTLTLQVVVAKPEGNALTLRLEFVAPNELNTLGNTSPSGPLVPSQIRMSELAPVMAIQQEDGGSDKAQQIGLSGREIAVYHSSVGPVAVDRRILQLDTGVIDDDPWGKNRVYSIFLNDRYGPPQSPNKFDYIVEDLMPDGYRRVKGLKGDRQGAAGVMTWDPSESMLSGGHFAGTVDTEKALPVLMPHMVDRSTHDLMRRMCEMLVGYGKT